MTSHQIDALEHGWIYLAIAALSSAAQWHFSAESRVRALSALHGILFIVAFLFAVALSPFEDASVHLFVPFLMLLGGGFLACLANPFLGASRLSVAFATSAATLVAGVFLTVLGMIAIQSTWF